MKAFRLKLDDQGALFEQLARALKRAILQGTFVAGGRLPATRVLAQALGVSRNTVLAAYELLCAEQLAIAHAGSGTRVTRAVFPRTTPSPHRSTKAPSRYAARGRALGRVTLVPSGPPLRYDLHYGTPSMAVPLFHIWRRKLAAAALRAGPDYPAPGGFRPLRAAICEYLARRRGVVCTDDRLLIVGGAQQATSLIARVVVNEGDAVAVEDPHYQFALHALLAHGARVVRVRTDRDGLVVPELPRQGARLICVTPSHQFPSGEVMAFSRRVELIEYAAKHGAWILEDDYDSEFRYAGKPIPALRSLDLADRVIYVGSFSKTLFPSIRLGYIVCPENLRDDLFRAKQLDDLGSPAIEQAALAAFMRSRQFEKYVRKSVAELRARRQVLLEGLQKHAGAHLDVSDSHAGMHIVVWFRHLDYAQADNFRRLAASKGLGLHPIHPYYREKPVRPGLLLGFAGLSAPKLARAAELFGDCLGEVLAPSRRARSPR